MGKRKMKREEEALLAEVGGLLAMVNVLKDAKAYSEGLYCGESIDEYEMVSKILDRALSVQVRDGWVEPLNLMSCPPGEYRITTSLTLRLTGKIGSTGYPTTCVPEYLHGGAWVSYTMLPPAMEQGLIEFAQEFDL